MVSLLKSWYGDKATKENDFGYSWVPKLDDGQDYSIMTMFDDMYDKKIKGLIVIGQNPACSLPNANKIRTAMTNLDWFVHMNIFDNETASFWKGPGMNPKKIKTEVFLLPAAASMEKAGSMTNSGRWVQWKYKAAQPPGDAISVGDIVYRIMSKIQDLYRKENGNISRSNRESEMGLCGRERLVRSLENLPREMNGYVSRGRDDRRQNL